MSKDVFQKNLASYLGNNTQVPDGVSGKKQIEAARALWNSLNGSSSEGRKKLESEIKAFKTSTGQIKQDDFVKAFMAAVDEGKSGELVWSNRVFKAKTDAKISYTSGLGSGTSVEGLVIKALKANNAQPVVPIVQTHSRSVPRNNSISSVSSLSSASRRGSLLDDDELKNPSDSRTAVTSTSNASVQQSPRPSISSARPSVSASAPVVNVAKARAINWWDDVKQAAKTHNAAPNLSIFGALDRDEQLKYAVAKKLWLKMSEEPKLYPEGQRQGIIEGILNNKDNKNELSTLGNTNQQSMYTKIGLWESLTPDQQARVTNAARQLDNIASAFVSMLPQGPLNSDSLFVNTNLGVSPLRAVLDRVDGEVGTTLQADVLTWFGPEGAITKLLKGHGFAQATSLKPEEQVAVQRAMTQFLLDHPSATEAEMKHFQAHVGSLTVDQVNISAGVTKRVAVKFKNGDTEVQKEEKLNKAIPAYVNALTLAFAASRRSVMLESLLQTTLEGINNPAHNYQLQTDSGMVEISFGEMAKILHQYNQSDDKQKKAFFPYKLIKDGQSFEIKHGHLIGDDANSFKVQYGHARDWLESALKRTLDPRLAVRNFSPDGGENSQLGQPVFNSSDILYNREMRGKLLRSMISVANDEDAYTKASHQKYHPQQSAKNKHEFELGWRVRSELLGTNNVFADELNAIIEQNTEELQNQLQSKGKPAPSPEEIKLYKRQLKRILGTHCNMAKTDPDVAPMRAYLRSATGQQAILAHLAQESMNLYDNITGKKVEGKTAASWEASMVGRDIFSDVYQQLELHHALKNEKYDSKTSKRNLIASNVGSTILTEYATAQSTHYTLVKGSDNDRQRNYAVAIVDEVLKELVVGGDINARNRFRNYLERTMCDFVLPTENGGVGGAADLERIHKLSEALKHPEQANSYVLRQANALKEACKTEFKKVLEEPGYALVLRPIQLAERIKTALDASMDNSALKSELGDKYAFFHHACNRFGIYQNNGYNRDGPSSLDIANPDEKPTDQAQKAIDSYTRHKFFSNRDAFIPSLKGLEIGSQGSARYNFMLNNVMHSLEEYEQRKAVSLYDKERGYHFKATAENLAAFSRDMQYADVAYTAAEQILHGQGSEKIAALADAICDELRVADSTDHSEIIARKGSSKRSRLGEGQGQGFNSDTNKKTGFGRAMRNAVEGHLDDQNVRDRLVNAIVKHVKVDAQGNALKITKVSRSGFDELPDEYKDVITEVNTHGGTRLAGALNMEFSEDKRERMSVREEIDDLLTEMESGKVAQSHKKAIKKARNLAENEYNSNSSSLAALWQRAAIQNLSRNDISSALKVYGTENVLRDLNQPGSVWDAGGVFDRKPGVVLRNVLVQEKFMTLAADMRTPQGRASEDMHHAVMKGIKDLQNNAKAQSFFEEHEDKSTPRLGDRARTIIYVSDYGKYVNEASKNVFEDLQNTMKDCMVDAVSEKHFHDFLSSTQGTEFQVILAELKKASIRQMAEKTNTTGLIKDVVYDEALHEQLNKLCHDQHKISPESFDLLINNFKVNGTGSVTDLCKGQIERFENSFEPQHIAARLYDKLAGGQEYETSSIAREIKAKELAALMAKAMNQVDGEHAGRLAPALNSLDIDDAKGRLDKFVTDVLDSNQVRNGHVYEDILKLARGLGDRAIQHVHIDQMINEAEVDELFDRPSKDAPELSRTTSSILLSCALLNASDSPDGYPDVRGTFETYDQMVCEILAEYNVQINNQLVTDSNSLSRQLLESISGDLDNPVELNAQAISYARDGKNDTKIKEEIKGLLIDLLKNEDGVEAVLTKKSEAASISIIGNKTVQLGRDPEISEISLSSSGHDDIDLSSSRRSSVSSITSSVSGMSQSSVSANSDNDDFLALRVVGRDTQESSTDLDSPSSTDASSSLSSSDDNNIEPSTLTPPPTRRSSVSSSPVKNPQDAMLSTAVGENGFYKGDGAGNMTSTNSSILERCARIYEATNSATNMPVAQVLETYDKVVQQLFNQVNISLKPGTSIEQFQTEFKSALCDLGTAKPLTPSSSSSSTIKQDTVVDALRTMIETTLGGLCTVEAKLAQPTRNNSLSSSSSEASKPKHRRSSHVSSMSGVDPSVLAQATVLGTSITAGQKPTFNQAVKDIMLNLFNDEEVVSKHNKPKTNSSLVLLCASHVPDKERVGGEKYAPIDKIKQQYTSMVERFCKKHSFSLQDGKTEDQLRAALKKGLCDIAGEGTKCKTKEFKNMQPEEVLFRKLANSLNSICKVSPIVDTKSRGGHSI